MKDVIAADGDLVIRRVRDHPADLARIVAWRNSPHVREWWDPDDPLLTAAAAVEELGLRGGGDHQTTSCIIELAGEPVGYIQCYPWDAEEAYLAEIGLSLPPGSWGLDVFIGDPLLAGRGIGSRAVTLLSDHLFTEESATAVALITEVSNARAQAAYVHAGMRVSGEPFHDTDRRDGQPVESILMIRDRPGGTASGR
ncbi:MAG TPA: GNAT family N-acetyltransferase [Candidatus Saccharimonadales bacterium]|nr:GNAT family N-acetyltransferase [Candidatus Saccharimonadales bacterium]